MAISTGERLPEATLLQIGENGPESVDLGERTRGRKVVIFGLPGAFTGTCTTAHVPSFMRTRQALADKGVDEVICVAVNDPFVMKAWGELTGATAAGLTLLGDADASFTKALGMQFTVPPSGFFDRSSRYSMLVEDGVVQILHREEQRGTCDISGGEAMLAAL